MNQLNLKDFNIKESPEAVRTLNQNDESIIFLSKTMLVRSDKIFLKLQNK